MGLGEDKTRDPRITIYFQKTHFLKLENKIQDDSGIIFPYEKG